MVHEHVATVFRKGGSVRGRARRAEFWRYAVVMAAGNQLALMLMGLTDVRALDLALTVVVGYLTGLGVATLIRRLHDTGNSGLMALWALIPLGVLVLWWLALRDGKPGPNKWGDSPKYPAVTVAA